MTTAKGSSQPSVVSDQSGVARLIPIGQLNTAPWNARKTFDQGALNELAESIRQQGVIVDLIVRLVEFNPGGSDSYEIVVGERRFRAAQIAGLAELPCKVRELDEDQAREVALVDNLQREDVPPMEEAAAFEELLKALGSIAAVAAKVSKEQAYVAVRLKLCTLTEWGRAALGEGLIAVDHALLLARLGADEQDAALKWCLDSNAGSKTPVEKVIAEIVEDRKDDVKENAKDKESYRWRHSWQPKTVQSLKDHIAGETGTLLSRAPWDLDCLDLIQDAAACNACPQNTKANAPLFADLEIGEATCTDGCCFKEKTKAFVRLQSRIGEEDSVNGKTAAGGAAPLLRVSWKATTTAPRMEKDGTGPTTAQTFKAGQWIEAKKKSCEHVRAAVTVDWSDANDRGYMGGDKKLRKPGEVVQVCVQQKCKAHRKGYERSDDRETGGTRDPKAEAEKLAKWKASAAEETKLRVGVAAKALASIKIIPAEAIRQIARRAMPQWGRDLAAAKMLLPNFKEIIETGKTDGAEFARAVAMVSIAELAAEEYRKPADGRDEFLASMKRLGASDAADAWKKLAKTPATKALVKATMKRVVDAHGRKVVADARKLQRAPKKTVARKGGHK